ncbi:MAG TPA: hypothetical protein VGR06_18715 [Actinophytocola sp.]|uniref:hypothetical protein n=1 Tax=Actinophytocola sp. TaxID=1872138 RepID=UPI002E052650|nr:hypothetical protein [Actinophytocola sp.]
MRKDAFTAPPERFGLESILGALLASPADLIRVPLFLLALLVVRGLLLYARLFGRGAVTATALVCAGLLSVLLFPLTALTLLRRTVPAGGNRSS